MVLNVDVSALTNLDKTGYDGLVKNFEENFQFSFYDGVGLSNILHVKIHVLWLRLSFARMMIIRNYFFLLSLCSVFSVKGSVDALLLCDILGAHLNVFD